LDGTPLKKTPSQAAAVTVRRLEARMIEPLSYKVTRKLLPLPSLPLCGDAAKDAELLVLRHENAVLRRQPTGPVRHEQVDRLRFAALPGLIPRCRRREVFPATPGTLLGRHPANSSP
jgi:hypothetical protein